MEVKLDSRRIDDCGKNIKKIAIAYKDEIDKMFAILESMSNFGEVWKGDSADKYIAEIQQGKKQYYDLYSNFVEMSNCLTSYASDISHTCQEIRSDANE